MPSDPPVLLAVPDCPHTHDLLIEHAAHWLEIRAFAEDSSGKRYVSKPVSHRPSWGAGVGMSMSDEMTNGWVIECELETHELEQRVLSGDWIYVPHDEYWQFRKEYAEMKAQKRRLGIEDGEPET